jgi:hypothetical protein
MQNQSFYENNLDSATKKGDLTTAILALLKTFASTK